ncbi:MAG TPA: arsenate reductase ArsC [Nitrospirae bacterium]|nr:arsenate-mycothiol transferase ArsC2 [bacterium BMS3Abin10]GBE39652.1 arsenate-mycothiol transferase ArsC2 [bacterium BMS3Bbin08]HDH00846.1 arsenate reductase ArsC [Nitrospirota bacterium]HDH50723.1 arsenate reductase ArsC [Nitrospirota bacterium]HDK81339.1 arsenate reductase ArsC [Nitrospirota bacterium]
MTEKKKIKVMFLCTANSCRSQMAEGLARRLGGDILEIYSAGLFAHYVQPMAIQVMKETGIDITNQTSDAIDEEELRKMDIIISLCGHAEKTCPATPQRIRRIHWPIDDPVGFMGTEEQTLNEFRRARDEIKEKIERFINELRA